MNKTNTITFCTLLRWNKPPRAGMERCPLQFWDGMRETLVCTEIDNAAGKFDTYGSAVTYWQTTQPAQRFDIAIVKKREDEYFYISHDIAAGLSAGSRRGIYLNGVLIGFCEFSKIKDKHYFAPRPELKNFLAAAVADNDESFVSALAYSSSSAGGQFAEEKYLLKWLVTAAMEASFADILTLWRQLEIAELRAHITLSPVGRRDDLLTSSVRRGSWEVGEIATIDEIKADDGTLSNVFRVNPWAVTPPEWIVRMDGRRWFTHEAARRNFHDAAALHRAQQCARPETEEYVSAATAARPPTPKARTRGWAKTERRAGCRRTSQKFNGRTSRRTRRCRRCIYSTAASVLSSGRSLAPNAFLLTARTRGCTIARH